MFQEREAGNRAGRGSVRTVMTSAMALAAVIVMARPAAAQEFCGGESVSLCGFVWNDTNGDGIQDPDETPVEGAIVTLYDITNPMTPVIVGVPAETGAEGMYSFDEVPPGTYQISVSTSSVDTNAEPSPANNAMAPDDTVDSDGVDDTKGNSVVTVVLGAGVKLAFDFGFSTLPVVVSPGTGTPGYWKNHPEVWPAGVTVGGVHYSTADAIALMGKVAKDKTITIFSSLVAATLNVGIGNASGCIASTIASANTWMAAHAPGSGVAASSAAWAAAEPLHKRMDDYNNGRMCAPHRN
jgi:hypothetical protein